MAFTIVSFGSPGHTVRDIHFSGWLFFHRTLELSRSFLSVLDAIFDLSDTRLREP